MILDRLMMLELERGTEHLQMKNIRTIATSLLLFQHCLFPVTIFAEEAPVEIDTELVQRLQEQNELPAIESSPPTTESTAEEPVHTEPAEVPTTEDSNPEQPEQSEQPKQPETVETTEPPIPETSEETAETTTPSAEDGKESSEGNGLPSPVLPKEEETEQLMVLPEAMRMSTYSLPNLNAYRHHLVDNGRSAYINQKMQGATNRTLTLGAGVGATQSFSVSFDTYTMVQAPGNGWISWIASNLSTAPDYYFQQMYYGNHPSFSNPYTLNNLRWSGVPSYLSVTATPTISGRQVTINVTIVRTKATTSDMNDKDTIRLLGNLTMGTTAVAPQVNNYSKKIADVNYSDAVIGEIVVNNPKPSVVIKDSVDVEATRNALSQDTIKSWFTTLPSNSNDYTFSATGPASWAPGATGTATVSMKHNSNGSTQTFTTRYTVRDTQKPTAKFKKTGVEIEARRTGDWTREDLLKFIDSDLQDNWSLPENIRIEATDNNGIYPLAGRSPRDTWAYVDIYDEAGNQYGEYIEFKIVDKQAPTGTVKREVEEVEARRSGDLSQAELRGFFSTMSDNWTLSENMKVHLLDETGTATTVAGKEPGTRIFYLQLEDEAGNKSFQMYIRIRIVDTQAPTGTLNTVIPAFEYRTQGDWSREELLTFFTGELSDNWSEHKNITATMDRSIVDFSPSVNLQQATLTLTDEAGNKQSYPVQFLLTSFVIQPNVLIQAQRMPTLSKETIKSWFQGLPSMVDDHYDFSTPESANGWEPGKTGQANVTIRNKVSNTTQQQTTNYTVVDTEAPKGTVKYRYTVEANRSRDFTQEELRQIFQSLSDNWSLPEKITLKTSNLTGLSPNIPGYHYLLKITATDEEKNSQVFENVAVVIEDTQAPTATVKGETIDVEARRTGGLTREELLRFVDGGLLDNWSLPDDISLSVVVPQGTGYVAMDVNQKPGTFMTGHLLLTDEFGNQTIPGPKNQISLNIRDTQVPTGTVRQDVSVEARRSGELSETELHGFMATMSDNWTLAENIKVHLVDGNETATTVAGKAPGIHSLYLQLEDEAGNKSARMSVQIRIVDTQRPTGTVKSGTIDIEACRSGELSQMELRGFFTTMSDNWTLPENLKIHLVNPSGTPLSIAGKAPLSSLLGYIRLEDEAGNMSLNPSTTIRIVDTQAPTGTVKSETIDVEARRTGELSQTELRQFVTTMSDNWTLAENMKVYLVNAAGAEVSIAGYKPGTIVPSFNSYIRLEDEARNKSMLMPITLRIVDTQAPEGTVKEHRLTMEADRSRNFTQEELRQFFEELSDNWSHLEDITLKSSGSLSSLGPNTENNHYVLAITATDEEKNSKRFERALVRINDTQAPTGTVKNEHMDIEARRTGELSQAELRQFFTSVNDNWTLSKDIKFHLVNADGSATSIAGMNPGTLLDAYIQLEDEAGNKSSPMKISANIVDTTGPQGKLKENLAFQKGSAEPNARDYLDGEPSDNWTAPEAIKVTVAYENNAQFTDLTVGTHKFVLTLADEYGNTTDLSGELEIKMNLKGYVDVTIPARISFAESKESGGIVSPKYQIQNNSNEELTVSVASMTSQSQTEKLTDIDLLMSNNYNDATIPLIENGQNLSQKTELVTLPKKTSSFAFSLYGTVGQNFDFDSLTDPLKPQYALQFNFTIN